jgi:hypothetical protein
MMLGVVEVFGLALLLLFLAAGLLGTILWIWMLVHAILNKGLTDHERLIWVLVIVFTHLIGALIYLFLGWPKKALAPTGRVAG